MAAPTMRFFLRCDDCNQELACETPIATRCQQMFLDRHAGHVVVVTGTEKVET
jgi:hypothetical protein